MGLDIRWPIGGLFSLIGVMMVVYGLVTGANTEMYKRSLGMNVNLGWGAVLVVFGVWMLIMAWRGSKQPPLDAPSEKPK
jgi:protein-S-isoprenylcysteine O-methyltransferase Ste14